MHSLPHAPEMQLLSADVGASLPHVFPPEFTHAAHELSAKHAETWEQQLRSRHAPQADDVFRYWPHEGFMPCCIPALQLAPQALAMQLPRFVVGASLLHDLPPEFTHAAHELSSKQAETSPQQFCAVHAPHGVDSFRCEEHEPAVSADDVDPVPELHPAPEATTAAKNATRSPCFVPKISLIPNRQGPGLAVSTCRVRRCNGLKSRIAARAELPADAC